jgi:type IV pilus assembly protein PilB
MFLSLPEVEKIVKESGRVEPQELVKAVETARHLEVGLEEVLIGRRLIGAAELGQMMAQAQGMAYIDLRSIDIPPEVLKLVSEEFAVNRHVVSFKVEKGVIFLAMEDPKDLEAIEFVKKHTGYEVRPVYADRLSIQLALKAYKESLQKEFAELAEKTVVRAKGEVSIVDLAKDVSVIKAVDTILEFAVVEDASDVHIEPLANEVVVRYRIDGVLHDVLNLPRELQPALAARIKILANLKLDETRLPQDGRMMFKSEGGEKVSLRVSVLPTVEGEKVVLRILEEALQNFSLATLGLIPEKEKLLKASIRKPHGMVLVTGPTGSGKTTTLYTILGMLNTVGVNISTVEDPVENRIRRVNQTQVNVAAGYVFAKGLRSLLRQDPDIIMVGEIRDKETAKIAVNAAMTGHLVLSTLHTNDAPGTIPRMLDLGVEPFLLASTLEMVVAQRLVRKICSDCKMELPLKKDWGKMLEGIIKDKERVEQVKGLLPQKSIRGRGGPECRYSGYKGRVGIFEVMKVGEKIRELIANRAAIGEIKAVALQEGMETMLVDGVRKLGGGVTTMEEVLRVSLE